MPKLWNETIAAHRREVRDAILDTTVSLVTHDGVSGVTMTRIAEEVGIGRATLYKYFADIDMILAAWHQRQISGHLERLREATERPGDPGAKVEAMLGEYARIQRERTRHGHGHAHGLELAAFLHVGDEVADAEQELDRMVQGLLTAAADAGQVRDDIAPRELARYCLHALAAASSLPSDAATRRLVDVVLAGLRAGRPGDHHHG